MGFLTSLFRAPERRTSLENPSFDISNPPDWAFDMLGARKAASGVNVNPETALTLDTVWRGITLISGDVGKLPLRAMKRLRAGGKEPASKHAAYWLLRHKPNEAMTAKVWKALMQAHALTFGNGYSYIYRDPATFRPLELYPLSPILTWPVRADGEVWYVTSIVPPGGGVPVVRKIPRHDMLHIKGFGPDGLQGYNWVSKARECLGLGMAAQMYSSVFFRNNARPNVVIKFPLAMDKRVRDELRDGWERMQSGLENAHRTAVIDRGGDIKELTINARDSQLIQTHEFSRVQVANFLGLPPHKLGDDSRTAYNSLEQENQAYLDDCLDGWLVNWEEECWDKLLTEEEKRSGDYEVLFDRRRLIRADLGARTTYYVNGLTNGWLNLDEVREEEDFNPLPDGMGQGFVRPLNLAPIAAATEEEDAEDLDDGSPAAPAGDLLAVPDIRQAHAWDCGAAAAQAVGQYFGAGPETAAEWLALVGATEADGTAPAAIAGAFLALGLAVTAGPLTLEDLAELFRQGRPVIVAMQTPAIPADGKRAGHYAVVLGVGLGQVFLQDPAAGRLMLAEADFLALWHDEGADGTAYRQLGIAVGAEALSDPPPPPAPELDAPPAAADDTPGQRAAYHAALDGSHRLLVTDALRRMCRRLAVHAQKAAREPRSFVASLERMEAEHAETVRAALSPALSAVSALRGAPLEPETVAKMLFLELKNTLLDAAGSARGSELEGAVERAMTAFEANFPGKLAENLLKTREKP